MDFSKALKSNPEKTVYPPLWNGPPRVESPEPYPVDDGDHQLLSEESPAYSASVIQRAFISWTHLGKKNSFRQTCDYYHRLEKLEETFSDEARLESRRLEYDIISQPPPMSAEFLKNYGYIYGYQPGQGSPDSGNGSPDPHGIWASHGIVGQVIPNGSMDPELVQASLARLQYPKS